MCVSVFLSSAPFFSLFPLFHVPHSPPQRGINSSCSAANAARIFRGLISRKITSTHSLVFSHCELKRERRKNENRFDKCDNAQL